jgi:hypothetical protein
MKIERSKKKLTLAKSTLKNLKIRSNVRAGLTSGHCPPPTAYNC